MESKFIMKPTIQSRLDEIWNEIFRTNPEFFTGYSEFTSGKTYASKKKQQFMDSVADAIREARIDELKQLLDIKGTVFWDKNTWGGRTFKDVQEIKDRISELQADTKDLL